MLEFHLILFLLAGVCFGLAAGGFVWQKVNFLALGLLLWVVVPLSQTLQKL